MSDSINKDTIEELKMLMEDDFPILIETFITDSDERVESLKSAIETQDANAVREIAHGFKGSSSNLGAVRLSEVSFELESMGRDSCLDNASLKYNDLLSAYSEVREYFNSLI